MEEQQRVEMDEGKTRQVVLSCFYSVLQSLAKIRIKMQCAETGAFCSDRQQPQWCMADRTSWLDHIQKLLTRIFNSDDETDRCSKRDLRNLIIPLTNETDVSQILRAYQDFCLLCERIASAWTKPPDCCLYLPSLNRSQGLFRLQVLDNNRLLLTWQAGNPQEDVLSAVERMLEVLRLEDRAPTCDEALATHYAYWVMSKGGPGKKSRPACPLGVPGFHAHTQTYMALTNPGEGHVQGTTRRADWMKGVLVHVEFIERPRKLMTCVGAYRMPSSHDQQRVRLHTGTAAPTTVYIGRFHEDPDTLDKDPVTVVNAVASAATLAFLEGAAECKISMFCLSTSQALAFMQKLGASVQKTPHQTLSAAWSLTRPLVDDLEEPSSHSSGQNQKEPVKLHKPVDIGLKAVEVTVRGGFHKVTLDGSEAQSPSRCILQQLGRQEAVRIVHLAHEYGLLTYFSAGFQAEDIPAAVRTGVDGIGIGGVLHFLDRSTGNLGPYKEEDISHILAKRDEGAEHILGKAASMLSRLDSMFYEGSISYEDDLLRRELFQALTANSDEQHGVENGPERKIPNLLRQLEKISALPSENFKPFLFRAKRLMEAETPLMRQSCSREQWENLRAILEPLLSEGDEAKVMAAYDEEPWVSMRRAWRSDRRLPVCARVPLPL